jgi:DNA-binding response OmpR family regulator
MLELMLPHLDGLNLGHILRQESDVPTTMLTAKRKQLNSREVNNFTQGALWHMIEAV